MSGADIPAIDESQIDRIKIRERLESVATKVEEHIDSDTKALASINAKLDLILNDRAKMIGATLAFATVIGLVAFMGKSYLQDAIATAVTRAIEQKR